MTRRVSIIDYGRSEGPAELRIKGSRPSSADVTKPGAPVPVATECRVSGFDNKPLGAEHRCILWPGAISPKGYARIRAGKSQKYAHRQIWEDMNGIIPEGMEIDHLCRNRSCINPAHMEVVSRDENQRRSLPFRVGKRKPDQCSNGHSLTMENALIVDGKRVCRHCRPLAPNVHDLGSLASSIVGKAFTQMTKRKDREAE